MAMMIDKEFYKVQQNILDKIGDDSVDKDQLKGLFGMFTLDVLRRMVDRKDKVLDSNLEKINNDQTVRTGRNEVLWNKRNKVLENDKVINEKGSDSFFDSQAESMFNNPKTHENSNILKDNPDWTFNPDEFADRNSPMYKVKQDWKKDYINQVLLPQHKNKYDQIDQNILTFDEYNTNNRELTKHAAEYAKRPEERSLFRQWNLFGKKRTAKLKEKYDASKKAQENILLEREGYLIGSSAPQLVAKDPETGDTFGSTLEGTKKFQDNIVRPLSGLTREMYEGGEVYNGFEFKNTQEFKTLSVQGKKRALDLFNQNEEYGDKNNSYELLNIFSTVGVLEAEQVKMRKYDTIKYSDPNFARNKPERQKNQPRAVYENSEPYKQWKLTVDEAYKEGSIKNTQARQKAGYEITRANEIELGIEENKEYITELRESARQLDNGEITQLDYDDVVKEYKDKTVTSIIERDLSSPDKIQSLIEGMRDDRLRGFLDASKTPAGKDAMDGWYVDINNRRAKLDLPPILPSQKENLYELIQTKHIMDDAAYMTTYLIIDPETGLPNVDPKSFEQYNISKDLIQE